MYKTFNISLTLSFHAWFNWLSFNSASATMRQQLLFKDATVLQICEQGGMLYCFMSDLWIQILHVWVYKYWYMCIFWQLYMSRLIYNTVKPQLSGLFTYLVYSLIQIIHLSRLFTYLVYSLIRTHVWEPIMIIYWENDSLIWIFSSGQSTWEQRCLDKWGSTVL